jgi:hypothetical protein
MPRETSSQKSKWQSFSEAFPVVQFVGGVIIAVCATWTTIQLTQNSQAAEIRRNGERIEKLEKESTPRELFDERTRTILDKQKETNDLINKLLEKK